MTRQASILSLSLITASLFAAFACGNKNTAPEAAKPGEAPNAEEAAPAQVTLTLGAYTTPREAYGKAIIPAFAKQLKAGTPSQELEVRESYLGSGAQARAILGGFEADIAALSLEPDIEKLKKGGLIARDWKANPQAGVVTQSIVVIGVRKGNPKNIKDWDDLAKPGVEVLTPDVRTSGGAIWNVAAIWGAALRGHTSAPKDNPDAAAKLLGAVLKNVKVFDKGARESLLTFEGGLGDAIITYENEILVGRQKGKDYEYIVPKSTILIENPVAVVDKYSDKHGNTKLADSFVSFLFTPEAQRAFADNGLRPVLADIAKETSAKFAATQDLFNVRDLGGWDGVQKTILDKDAGYDRALAASRGELAKAGSK